MSPSLFVTGTQDLVTWTDDNMFELANADLLFEAATQAEMADIARVLSANIRQGVA